MAQDTHAAALAIPDQSVINVTHLANIVRALYSHVFKAGVDYGVIPNTGDKPTLLLPGMEKLMRAMNAVPVYRETCVIRDYDKPLFHYEYECTLIDADTSVPIPGGRAIGLATSMEGKWRWRKADRACPKCRAATIRRSKYPPRNDPQAEPGWYCSDKACGAQYDFQDPVITTQQVGRVENTDIFDQLNTIAKIAQKRSMSSAVKGAANVSELFTVDLDDLVTYPAYEREPDRDTGEIITVQAEVVTATTPPPAPATTPALSQAGINNLITEARAKGYNDAELLIVLNVSTFDQYTGTFADARALIRKLPRKPADGTEPEQVHF